MTLVTLLAVTVCQAQDEDVPRLLLDTSGPVGRVHALRFVPSMSNDDDHRLIAVGADKQAYEWILHSPDQAGGPFRFVQSHLLRWEIARGPNGVIYAADISPDGEFVAFAGRSARSNGDIWVYNRLTRDLHAVLEEHRHKVVSLSFSLDGQRLASVDETSHLQIWSMPKGERLFHRRGGDVRQDRQPVLFLPDNVLLSTEFVTQSMQRLIAYNHVTRAVTNQPFPVNSRRVVTALARNGRSPEWACALANGEIALGNGVRPPTRTLKPKGPQIGWLEFGLSQLLLASTARDGNGMAWLELWDTTAGRERMIDRVALGENDASYACAVSDDGRLAAVYANGPRELWVFPLLDAQGQLPKQPLSGQSALRLSSGHDIEGIEFLEDDGSRLKIEVAQNDPRTWEFNAEFGGIKRTTTLEQQPQHPGAAPAQPQAAPAAAPAKRRNPQPGSQARHVPPDRLWQTQLAAVGFEIHAHPAGQPARKSVIQLDPEKQGRARYRLLLPQTTDEQAWIAVGTDRDGLFIYRVPAGQRGQLVRHFRDHTGPVTHLAASSDGSLLASLAEDRIVKIWSLEKLTETRDDFPRYAAWGAAFVATPQRVEVRDVIEHGIAARRGLADGDIIQQVRWSAMPQQGVNNQQPQAILTALSQLPLWTTLEMHWRRPAGPAVMKRNIVPGWEPLVSMFLDRSGEWAVWMPDGTYNASADGDTLFGWQRNKGKTTAPEYFPAGRFRERFERREDIQRLFGHGGGLGPLRPKSLSTDIAGQARVRLLQPLTGAVQPPGKLRVTARITQGGSGVKKPQLYVNYVPIQSESQQMVDEFTWEIPWTAELSLNKIEVVAGGAGPGLPASDAVYVRSVPRGRPMLHVHLLAIGVSEYGSRIPKAANAAQDAEDLVQFFQRSSGTHYKLPRPVRLTDADVSRQQVLTNLRRLGSQAYEPHRDVVIFYFAGHGSAVGSPNPTFYFVLPDNDLLHLEDVPTLRRSSLTLGDLEPLLDLPCQKLFVVDACESGFLAGLDPEHVEDGEKRLIRSLKDRRAMIFTATSDGSAFGVFAQRPRNGLFTGLLLQGLEGPADDRGGNQDQTVTLREAVDYVRGRITAYYEDQHPVFAPADVFDIYDLPLSRAGDR